MHDACVGDDTHWLNVATEGQGRGVAPVGDDGATAGWRVDGANVAAVGCRVGFNMGQLTKNLALRSLMGTSHTPGCLVGRQSLPHHVHALLPTHPVCVAYDTHRLNVATEGQNDVVGATVPQCA